MRSNEQIVTDEYRIDDKDGRRVPCDRVQYSWRPFYVPFSISCDDSGTRFLSDVRLGRAHGQFRCVSGVSGND